MESQSLHLGGGDTRAKADLRLGETPLKCVLAYSVHEAQGMVAAAVDMTATLDVIAEIESEALEAAFIRLHDMERRLGVPRTEIPQWSTAPRLVRVVGGPRTLARAAVMLRLYLAACEKDVQLPVVCAGLAHICNSVGVGAPPPKPTHAVLRRLRKGSKP